MNAGYDKRVKKFRGGIGMIKFKEFIGIVFYSKGTTFSVIPDGEESKKLVLRGSEAFKEIADLLDKYVIEKFLITEEWSRIDHTALGFTPLEERYMLEERTVVSLILIKDKRVKALFNMQPLPKRLLEHLPDEVLKELRPTSRQVGMIKWLEEEVEPPEFRRSSWEIVKYYTKREASEIIKVLLEKKRWFDELVEKSKQANSSTTA